MKEPPKADATSEATAGAPTSTDTRSATSSAIDDLTGGRTVPLNHDGLPSPPAGFTRADVESFADRAIDIIERGVSPELHGKAPAQAFRYVFANQYDQTTDLVRRSSKTVAGSYDWEWIWASLFEVPPTAPPRFLAVRWQVDTVPGVLEDGTRASSLEVVLSTAVEHLVVNETAGTQEPIVMQRTVIVRGFRPLGDPDWWPVVGAQVNPLFGGKCAPVNGSILTPVSDPKTVATDLKALRRFLGDRRAVNADQNSGVDDIADLVDRYCDE